MMKSGQGGWNGMARPIGERRHWSELFKTKPPGRQAIRTPEEKKAIGRRASENWKRNNPDRVKATAKRYRDNDRTREKARKLMKDYGMSLDAYWQMVTDQHGLCAICTRGETASRPSGIQLSLSVDHDHATGEVRGLLCQACNSALGLFRDSCDNLRAATEYLREHGSSQ